MSSRAEACDEANERMAGENSTITTDAGAADAAEVAAAEKTIRAQALSLRENRLQLSKIMHQENAKLAHKEHLEAAVEAGAHIFNSSLHSSFTRYRS